MKKILILMSILMIAVLGIGCSSKEKEVVEPIEKVGDIKEPIKKEKGDLTMEKEAEQNAEQYPAKPGAILVTKGNHKFTGMNYYFKGEVVAITNIDNNVGDPSAWLVKNENGYVMPIQHDFFEAEIGDTVEIWGTLTGNGYSNLEGIDNVVGETGSMHAMSVNVNGERQY